MEPATQEEKRLEALRRYDILDTEPEETFDQLTRIGAGLFNVPICAIGLLDEHRVWCKSIIGVNAQDTAREHSFCTHAIRRAERPFIVADAVLDARFSSNPFVKGEPHVRFYAGAPLVSSEGEAIGVFCVVDYAPRPGGLTNEQTVLLRDLASVTMALIEARLEKRTAREAEGRARPSAPQSSDRPSSPAYL